MLIEFSLISCHNVNKRSPRIVCWDHAVDHWWGIPLTSLILLFSGLCHLSTFDFYLVLVGQSCFTLVFIYLYVWFDWVLFCFVDWIIWFWSLINWDSDSEFSGVFIFVFLVQQTSLGGIAGYGRYLSMNVCLLLLEWSSNW